MKNKIIIVIICACMGLSVTGCGVDVETDTERGKRQEETEKEESEQGKQKQEESDRTESEQGKAEQKKPEQEESEQERTEQKESEQEELPTEYACYEKLIAGARECVIRNDGELPEGYDWSDFSSMLYMKKDWDYGTLGYLIKDIDGNGTAELLFGGNSEESSGWYDSIIYDVYTISDGEMVHILDGWERSRYFLCENGVIAHEGENSAFEGTRSYFKLAGTELHLVESIIWVLGFDGTREEEVYYYTTETEYDTENAEIIGEEQADAVIEKYPYVRIEFIPL